MANIRNLALAAALILSLGSPVSARAEEAAAPSGNLLIVDSRETLLARVVTVDKTERRLVPGTEVESVYQTIQVEILEGAQRGKVVRIENDYLQLEEGESFYLIHTVDGVDGHETYAVGEPRRLPQLFWLTLAFVVLSVAVGGWQGFRGLVSLGGSLALIVFVLFPLVLAGYSPVLVSVGVCALVVVVGSYVTHGLKRSTSAAVIGMVATVAATGCLAWFSVGWARLSGFSDEAATYLNLNTGGQLDMAGLLLGGILIGLLGVLYDAAIGQAVAVEELAHVAPHAPRALIFRRATRIGREHIGALVNTLAIAYVGAALPLLLYFYLSPTSSLRGIVNMEIFAVEVVRTMIGSIGLILAVPVTTAVAVRMLVRQPAVPADAATLEREKRALEHAGHGH